MMIVFMSSSQQIHVLSLHCIVGIDLSHYCICTTNVSFLYNVINDYDIIYTTKSYTIIMLLGMSMSTK